MAKFNLGETIYLQIEIKDPITGVLTDPDTSITIQVNDPTGTEFLATDDMVRLSTGIYAYNLATLSNSVKGNYQVKFQTIDGVFTTIEWFSFNLGR